MAGKHEEQMKEITERLEQGVKELFTSEKYTAYLKTMAQFHHYSFNNTVLIMMQKPDATLVAGYNAWKKKFSRQVKRGEKGIQIIAPVPVKISDETPKFNPVTNEPVLRPDGQPEMEVVERLIPRFRTTTVFDISQTEGDPLPEIDAPELMGSVENFKIFMEAIRKASPVPMQYAQISGESKGYYSNQDKKIVIQEGMSERQTMKTAVHEMTHAMCHDRDLMEELGEQKDQITREVEAESVAYTVCQYFGLDTSDYSFPYIAGWSSDMDMNELRSSMEFIRKTAGSLIDSISENIQAIQKQLEEGHLEENDLVLKVVFPLTDEFTYMAVENMDREELLAQMQSYYELYAQGGEMTVETFLEWQGARLIPFYDSSGLMTEKPVSFYDFEYEYDTGVVDAATFSAEEQAEMLISRAEYQEIVFDTQDKKLIVEYAKKFDDIDAVKALIRELAEAGRDSDMQAVQKVRSHARAEMDKFPDRTLGFSAMHWMGYHDDSMLPLTRERALELYRAGLDIYSLQADNKAFLLPLESDFYEEKGIFGVKAEEWESYRELEKGAEPAHGSQKKQLGGKQQAYGQPEKGVQQMDAQQKLRLWMGKIPGYTKELFTPEKYPHFLDVMLQYSKYGFDNAVLIAAQCREKELALADRGMWEKKYERHVRDGGAGIQVIVPVKARKKDVRVKAGPETRKPAPRLDGKAEMGQVGAAKPRLHVHTVYNVSQTEGRPLPERPACEMRADADNFDMFIKAITALSPVPVNFAEFGSGKQEYSFNADGEIVIQKGMDAARTMQTAARTVARALIDEIGQMMEPSAPQGWETVGIETESVAYMFCRYFEMDTAGWHFENIAGWHDSMGLEALRSSMNMVRKVAEIFNSSMVDSMLQEMMRETRKELDKQVYYYTAGYARENGEMDAYLASRKENIACREAIEQTIRENFDGMHLKQGAVKPVMEDFGAERVAYVLASTVRYIESDGHISMSNKSWAHTIQGLRDDDGQSRDSELDFVVGSHPGVLDLFINQARKYISGLEKAETGKDEVEMEKDGSVQMTAAAQEQQKLPPVSDMREPEAALGNLSRAEIEETVFSYVQAALEDAGMSQEVEILGVRVYGSRSRDGMYTEKSDLDVVVSYSGEIREDAFFNMMHTEKFQIAGLDVDINPISAEKTGTLEDYLESADKYLDMKEAQMQASGQEAALRQEERAEQISFFVAECAGHPVAGRYREGLTLQEAVGLYQKISEDKAGSVPGIGFRLEGGSVHDGDYMLMTDGKIQKEDIIQNAYLRDNPLVEKAVTDLETLFPDRSGQAVTEAQKKLEKEPEKLHLQEEKDVGAPSGTDAGTFGKTGKMEKEKPAGQTKGTGRKESVLKALRERQAKMNVQEKGQPKQKTQAYKKGEAEL